MRQLLLSLSSFTLLGLLVTSLAGCPASAPPRERCRQACDRARMDPDCGGYDQCIATCDSPAIDRCGPQLEAYLSCANAIPVEDLCGIGSSTCPGEILALGFCVSSAADGGTADAGM